MFLEHDDTTCFGIKLVSKAMIEIKFSDVYATEFINYGIIHGLSLPNAGRHLLGHKSEVRSIPIVAYVFTLLTLVMIMMFVVAHFLLHFANVSLHDAWF